MLFLSVRGFSDYAGPTVHSRLAWLPCCLPPTRNEVGVLIYGLFAAQSPRPPMPLSTLQETSHDVPCKTRGQDGFATSFPVGLFHPLHHPCLARRSPVCPALVSNQRTSANRVSTKKECSYHTFAYSALVSLKMWMSESRSASRRLGVEEDFEGSEKYLLLPAKHLRRERRAHDKH